MRLSFLITFLLLPSTFAIPISLASFPHTSLERKIHPAERTNLAKKATIELHESPVVAHAQRRGLFGFGGKGSVPKGPKAAGTNGWEGVLPYVYNKVRPGKKPKPASDTRVAASADHYAMLGLERPGADITPPVTESRLAGQLPGQPKFKPKLATIKESKKEGGT